MSEPTRTNHGARTKLRLLLAFPFVMAALLVAAVHLSPASAQRNVMRVEIETVKLLGLIGCWLAAFSFERGDYLRRAWLLSGACFLFLLIRDVTLGQWTPWAPGPRMFGLPTEMFESALVLTGNAAAVLGSLMLARAWSVAGLGDSDDRVRRIVLFAVAALIGLVVVSNNMLRDVRSLEAGNLSSLVMIASDVGDVVSMALIAPVLLTALALRGGLLLWPWSLLAASMIAWLCYDSTSTVGQVVNGGTSLRVTVETFRCLACTFSFSAGVAQRIVLDGSANTNESF